MIFVTHNYFNNLQRDSSVIQISIFITVLTIFNVSPHRCISSVLEWMWYVLSKEYEMHKPWTGFAVRCPRDSYNWNRTSRESIKGTGNTGEKADSDGRFWRSSIQIRPTNCPKLRFRFTLSAQTHCTNAFSALYMGRINTYWATINKI
jgi:hypothetical protein